MTNKIDIELDSIELFRLEQLASINNVEVDELASVLLAKNLSDMIDSIIVNDDVLNKH